MPRPLIRALLGLVALGVLFLAVRTGLVGGAAGVPFAKLESAQKNHLPYAARMAGTLYDTPQCRQYRDAIMEAGKGPPLSGATTLAIEKAYEAGKKAGCRKPS